jgi:hypothetical protein
MQIYSFFIKFQLFVAFPTQLDFVKIIIGFSFTETVKFNLSALIPFQSLGFFKRFKLCASRRLDVF